MIETVLAIDPGTDESGYVVVRAADHCIVDKGVVSNAATRELCSESDAEVMVIEMIGSYGKPVGTEVFQTVLWIGRFIECYETGGLGGVPGGRIRLMYRREIKTHLCGGYVKTKDSTVRQTLIDRYGPGKRVAIGLKNSPGPLYGVTTHMWSALALAITYLETETGDV